MSGDTDEALKLAPTRTRPLASQDLLAHLLGSLARTSFNAGHEDRGKRSTWRNGARSSASYPLATLGSRLSAIAELDECLPALGDESLIRPLYEDLDEWKILRYSPT